MTREDGIGKWWEGLDPQDLYAQYHIRGKWGWNLAAQGGSPPSPRITVKSSLIAPST